MNSMTRILTLFGCAYLGACTQIPADNPFDPDAAETMQAPARVQGRIVVPVGYNVVEAMDGARVTVMRSDQGGQEPMLAELNALACATDEGQDACGRFLFPQLTPADYSLEVQVPGMQVLRIYGLGIGIGESRDLGDLVLQAADASGRASGFVRLSPEPAEGHGGILIEVVQTADQTLTNPEGAWSLDLAPNTYDFRFTKIGYGTSEQNSVVVTDGEVTTVDEVVLAGDPGVITGRVTLEGASVHGGTTVSLVNTSLTGQTDDDGTFRIDGVPAGLHIVRFSKDGYAPLNIRGVEVKSEPDIVLDDMRLSLARGGVSGTIGLADTATLAGTSIEILGTSFSATTDASGQFRIEGIPVGDYTLRSCRQGYEPADLPVSIMMDEVSTAPPAESPQSLARQQIRLAEASAVTSSNIFSLRFATLPDWVNAIKIAGDLAATEETNFRAFDAGDDALMVNLSDGDGPKLIEIQVQGEGCRLSDVQMARVIVDSQPPEIFVTGLGGRDAVEAGFPLNENSAVPLEVNCFDDQALAVDLRLQLTQGDSTTVVDYAPVVTVDLPNVEGSSVLTVACLDPAGNVSANAAIPYVLDRTSPRPGTPLRINDGAPYVNARQVLLNLDVVDGGSGVESMSIGNGALDCDTADYGPYRSSTAWVLPPDDGRHTVFVCLRDAAGNVTQVSEEVYLDATPPSVRFNVKEGTHSRTSAVSLESTRLGDESTGAVRMRIETGIFDCKTVPDEARVDFEPLVNGFEVGSDGAHQISACFYDAAGNHIRSTQTVTIDTQIPTGTLQVNGGDAFTAEAAVEIIIRASGDVTGVKIENVDGPTSAIECSSAIDFEPFSPLLGHRLSSGDGQKFIRACVRDAAGNSSLIPPESAAGIVLDTTSPTLVAVQDGGDDIGLRLSNGDASTNAVAMPVSLRARDETSGVSSFKLSQGSNCQGGTWQDWSASQGAVVETVLSLAEGDYTTQTLSVLFMDAAGNISDCSDASIMLDTVSLSLTAFALVGDVDDSANHTTTTELKVVELNHGGLGECDYYELSLDPSFASSGVTVPCAHSDEKFVLPDNAEDGLYTIYARVMDKAGNASMPLSVSLTLDRRRPELTELVAKNGRSRRALIESICADTTCREGQGLLAETPITDERDAVVTIVEAIGEPVFLNYVLREAGSLQCPDVGDSEWIQQPFSSSFVASFEGQPDGRKRICAYLTDRAGNTSRIHTASLAIDTQVPPPPILLTPNQPGVNRRCTDIEVTHGLAQDDFWFFEAREAGQEWRRVDDTIGLGRGSSYGVRFGLLQDADNLLQIRTVDRAGNRSESVDTLVEEVSSYLIPTNLELKQLCNAGQYAILKEPLDTTAVYRRPKCFPGVVFLEKSPEHAILNLEKLTVQSLNPALSIADLGEADCEGVPNQAYPLDAFIVDAVCSPEPNKEALLFTRATSAQTCLDTRFTDDEECAAIAAPPEPCNTSNDCPGQRQCLFVAGQRQCADAPKPLLDNYGFLELAVFPDPIGNPLAGITTLGTLIEEDSEGYGIALGMQSMDVIKWTGNPRDGDFSFVGLSREVTRNHEYDPDAESDLGSWDGGDAFTTVNGQVTFGSGTRVERAIGQTALVRNENMGRPGVAVDSSDDDEAEEDAAADRAPVVNTGTITRGTNFRAPITGTPNRLPIEPVDAGDGEEEDEPDASREGATAVERTGVDGIREPITTERGGDDRAESDDDDNDAEATRVDAGVVADVDLAAEGIGDQIGDIRDAVDNQDSDDEETLEREVVNGGIGELADRGDITNPGFGDSDTSDSSAGTAIGSVVTVASLFDGLTWLDTGVTTAWRTGLRPVAYNIEDDTVVMGGELGSTLWGSDQDVDFDIFGLGLANDAADYLQYFRPEEDQGDEPARWFITTTDLGGIGETGGAGSGRWGTIDPNANYATLAGTTQFPLTSDASDGSPQCDDGDSTCEFNDSADRPYRNRIGPANYAHLNCDGEDDRTQNFVYLDSLNGKAMARCVGGDETPVELGRGAEEGAVFFEVAKEQVYWVDALDERVLIESSNYRDRSSEIRLRYAVDKNKPIFPAMKGFDANGNVAPGQPYVIYHTTGVTRGLVVVFRDEHEPNACDD